MFVSFVFVEMPLLIGAIASVLLMHPSLGSAAIDALASIGIMDPKLGVPLLLAILFYNNIFTRKAVYQNMVVRIPTDFPKYCVNSSCAISARHYSPLPQFLSSVYFFFLIKFLQPKLLGMLPSLASQSGMIPLVVQIILPMLHKDAKPYVLFR